jgi:hypothetical protein
VSKKLCNYSTSRNYFVPFRCDSVVCTKGSHLELQTKGFAWFLAHNIGPIRFVLFVVKLDYARNSSPYVYIAMATSRKLQGKLLQWQLQILSHQCRPVYHFYLSVFLLSVSKLNTKLTVNHLVFNLFFSSLNKEFNEIK